MTEDPILSVQGVAKEYERGGQRVRVLDAITMEVPRGDYVALMGPSGSGKTTLLNIIGGLDAPTAGVEQNGANGTAAPGVTRADAWWRSLDALRARSASHSAVRGPGGMGHDTSGAIVDTLKFFGERGEVSYGAYAIMPDHVHVVIRIHDPLTLSGWLRRFKSYTTKLLGPGRIWQSGCWSAAKSTSIRPRLRPGILERQRIWER